MFRESDSSLLFTPKEFSLDCTHLNTIAIRLQCSRGIVRIKFQFSINSTHIPTLFKPKPHPIPLSFRSH